MSIFKNGKLKYLIFAVFFIIGLIYLFFNDSGVVKYFKLKHQVDSLNVQIENVDKDNKLIKAEIDSLQNKVPAKIEKTAREKYDMIRKGEKKIQVIEK